jgi:hypothetical protein
MLDNHKDLFLAGQPNGGKEENCVITSFHLKRWLDKRCQEKFSSFCHFKSHPIFKARGKGMNSKTETGWCGS